MSSYLTGWIEYLDVNEEKDSFIAFNESHIKQTKTMIFLETVLDSKYEKSITFWSKFFKIRIENCDFHRSPI